MKRAAGLALGALLLAACTDPPTPVAAPAAAPLASVVIEPARVARETRFDGVVEAVNQATVSAQTGGRVEELPFDVGDYVEQGQLIVRLRATEQRARLSSAEAGRAEAQARRAEAQLAFDRTKDMYDKKLVAKAALDRAEAELKSAAARAAAAAAGVREAGEGAAHTVVNAPYSGIVVQRHVELGESVTVGQKLMTGLSLQHLRVVVDVPQQQMGPLRKHRKARAILADGRSVEISELRIPPSADPVTHSFHVLATLSAGSLGADANVFPGTLLKIAFVSGELEQLRVPAAALVRRGELTAVYVSDAQNRIELRALAVGTPGPDGGVPVLAGLLRGERVILDPLAAALAYAQQDRGA